MSHPFHDEELKVLRFSGSFRGAQVPIFHYPIPTRDAWRQMALERKPLWLGTGAEVFSFYPDIIPDNRARGFVNDGGIRLDNSKKGGKDMFGIEWEFIPVAGGSIEKPGIPHLFEDANDWENVLVWPDVDAWDWEGCAKRNKEFLNNGCFNSITFLNGFGFERLISFMGFEEAAMALIDEDQQDALAALFDRLADLYCAIIDRCCAHFDIDGFQVHDDWGSQLAPFFSFEVGRKLIVPAMRKVTDRIHSHGKVAELHSCGCNERQIENYIAAGFDIWGPMAQINDTKKLFREYGDRIIIGVAPDPYDPERDSEEEIRAKARAFVEEYCSDPNRVCIINRYFAPLLRDAYAEELYKASRLVYENN